MKIVFEKLSLKLLHLLKQNVSEQLLNANIMLSCIKYGAHLFNLLCDI